MRRLLLSLSIVSVLVASPIQATSRVPALPDPKLTPGEVRPGVRLKDLCGEERIHTRDVRNVPQSMKRAVMERYGLSWSEHRLYEIDHLIPLSMQGANSLNNLWPQSWRDPGAHMKDRLEVRATHDVCKGKIKLEVAQRKIARDWLGFFREEFPR